MRILAGGLRGRRLQAPQGDVTRPTAERLRQALFDILAHAPWVNLPGAVVLDVFAGTGALGLEALSRGAASVTFVERNPAALAALRANIAACGVQAVTRVEPGDALRPAAGAAANLVFLDPPYGSGLIGPALAALQQAGRIDAACVVVAELGAAEPPPSLGRVLAERRHGAGRVVITAVPAQGRAGDNV